MKIRKISKEKEINISQRRSREINVLAIHRLIRDLDLYLEWISAVSVS